MKTDMEISHECNMLNIKEVAKKINIDKNRILKFTKEEYTKGESYEKGS